MSRCFSSRFLPVMVGLASSVRADVVVQPGNLDGAIIEREAGATRIRLSGPARIEWQQFQVNRGETLEFQSLGGPHASLNAVRSAVPASIQGSIKADGPFYLISPSGIQVGAGGTIQAPSVLLSSLTANDEAALLRGGATTFRPSGAGVVSVDGQVSATTGGSIVILGSSVRTGLTAGIEAPEGRVQVMATGGTVSGSSGQGFVLDAEGTAVGKGLISQEGSIAARQVQILSDGFLRNSGRLLARGPGNTISLAAPQIIHEKRDGERSLLSTQRLLIQGNFRQEGPVINPDDGANPSPVAGLRQTPRLSGSGFITSVSPGQTQLGHAPLQTVMATVSPIPAPTGTPALITARRGPESKAKPKSATGTVKKSSFFGQTINR